MSEKENFNLHDLINHPDLVISLSKSSQEKIEDARLRRFKDRWLFLTTLFVVIGMFIVCSAFVLLTFRDNSQYTGIALNGVIGIGLALAGYYVRGK